VRGKAMIRALFRQANKGEYSLAHYFESGDALVEELSSAD